MEIYNQLAKDKSEGKSVALCVITKTSGSTPRRAGAKMLVYPDGSISGTIGGGEFESKIISEALSSLKNGKTRNITYTLNDPKKGDPGICGGQMEVYVEPILNKPTLLIIGAGHIGNMLVQLGSWLDFNVVIADDREGFANPEKQPDANHHIKAPLSEIIKKSAINEQTYIVMTTRNLEVDVELLPKILKLNPSYIGVIGSKRRWFETKKQLGEKKIEPNLIEKVHSPTGIEINAETPKEIALSIMAEIIMLREGGTGKQMKA